MIEETREKYEKLEEELNNSTIIGDPRKLGQISKELSDIKSAYDLIVRLDRVNEDLRQNMQLMGEETDEDMLEMVKVEIGELEALKLDLEKELNLELKPKDPRDKKNCIVEIRAGTGGDESALFAAELFRMYSKYAESKKWKLNILDSNSIGIGGLKEIIFEVKGDNVYGELKYESGTHRVQRVPETEKQGRIHTSAATVVVLAEAEEIELEIKNEDIRVDTFCSSGPGGQSVNTTYSAIRLTYIPTGLIVSCQDQKSQHQNKEKAMQILRSRLLAQEEEKKRKEQSDERLSQVGGGDRSDKVRTYNFPQDRITDHRINQSWYGIDKIIDGGVGVIIDALRES
ncbi:peptide chain release factor 1 [Patescibacteria group bacterium]|nr:peptide chain release factor 1 [Patescibacteria group bacterium]